MTLENLMSGIDRARLAVIGDFCLDVYWLADMRKSEISRETPHFPLPIVEERLQPGGAGNVVCNLLALKPASVRALGVVGRDWRGRALCDCLEQAGADIGGFVQENGYVTNAYCKPLRRGISEIIYEDPRLDFENHRPIAKETEERLLSELDALNVDTLCVCDQLRWGCITKPVREKICRLGEQGMRVIVDSRDRIGEYRGVWVKPNEVEAARAMPQLSPDDHASLARAMYARAGKGAIVTLGAKGCVVCEDGERVVSVPAREVEPPIDFCGAGDAFLSALACAMCAGATTEEAALFANTASAVTLKKLNMTGTASREEIRALWNT